MKSIKIMFFLSSVFLIISLQSNGLKTPDDFLFFAIKQFGPSWDSSPAVREQLEKGANPNAQKKGKTAIMQVIEEKYAGKNRIKPLLLLLERTNNVDFVADNGMTALTFAASLGDDDMVNVLLENGANRYKKDAYGMDYLDYIVENEIYENKPNELKAIRIEREKNLLNKELSEFEVIRLRHEIEEEEYERREQKEWEKVRELDKIIRKELRELEEGWELVEE